VKQHARSHFAPPCMPIAAPTPNRGAIHHDVGEGEHGMVSDSMTRTTGARCSALNRAHWRTQKVRQKPRPAGFGCRLRPWLCSRERCAVRTHPGERRLRAADYSLCAAGERPTLPSVRDVDGRSPQHRDGGETSKINQRSQAHSSRLRICPGQRSVIRDTRINGQRWS